MTVAYGECNKSTRVSDLTLEESKNGLEEWIGIYQRKKNFLSKKRTSVTLAHSLKNPILESVV